MPYYGRFCKRPCFSDDYLPAFNRPNVTLIDTEGQGPERISEHAVHSGGTAYEVDCIIYATGFESFAKSPSQSGRYNVIGRDGVTLDDKWGGESFASLHGLYTNGFPNMFVLGSSRQSAATFNIPYRMFIQANHVIELITELSKSGVTSMEVKREAELRWGELQDSLRGDADITKVMLDCTPGYYNNEGRVGGADVPVVAAGYPGGTIQFREQIDSWRQRGEFREDFILRSTSGVNGSCDEIEDIFFDTSEVS
jgi:cyclohexanone monooxygenase